MWLGHLLIDLCCRVLYLRQLHGQVARIKLCRTGVKDALRQILVDPKRAAAFGYFVGNYVAVDLRLQLGRRSSPGLWGLLSAALKHAYKNTTFPSAIVSRLGCDAVAHVDVSIPARGEPVSVPTDCSVVPGERGFAGDAFFVRYYVDDGILVEVHIFKDDCRCLRPIQSLACDHVGAAWSARRWMHARLRVGPCVWRYWDGLLIPTV